MIPGTKIRVPAISEQLSDELDEVEPFIEDYYPKLEWPLPKPKITEEELPKDNVEEVIKTTKSLPSKKPNLYHKPLIYNPYYIYPNPYMYNNYYRSPRKKKSR